jgi:hypothetical protein
MRNAVTGCLRQYSSTSRGAYPLHVGLVVGVKVVGVQTAPKNQVGVLDAVRRAAGRFRLNCIDYLTLSAAKILHSRSK